MAGWFLFCLCPGPAQPELRFQEPVVQKILKQENQSGEPGEGRQDIGGLGWHVVSEDLGLYATPEISPFSLEWSGYFIRATGTETSTDTL